MTAVSVAADCAARWETPFLHKSDAKVSTFKERDPVFPVTNEDMHKAVYPELRDAPVRGDTYVGVSGLQNLAFFACRPKEVDRLVIIDPSNFQKVYWEIIREAVFEAETGPGVANLIFERTNNYADMHELAVDEESIQYLQTTDSVFYNEVAWDKIKCCIEEGRLHILSVDLGDFEVVSNFRDALKAAGQSIDTVYISNLNDTNWLGDEKTKELVDLLRGEGEFNLLLCKKECARCFCCGRMPIRLFLASQLPHPETSNNYHCLTSFPMRFLNLIDKMRFRIISNHCTVISAKYFENDMVRFENKIKKEVEYEWVRFFPTRVDSYRTLTRDLLFNIEAESPEHIRFVFCNAFPERFAEYQANPPRWPFEIECVNRIFQEIKDNFLAAYFADDPGALDSICSDFSTFRLIRELG